MTIIHRYVIGNVLQNPCLRALLPMPKTDGIYIDSQTEPCGFHFGFSPDAALAVGLWFPCR